MGGERLSIYINGSRCVQRANEGSVDICADTRTYLCVRGEFKRHVGRVFPVPSVQAFGFKDAALIMTSQLFDGE